MEEIFPGLNHRILSYIIGFDSLKATSGNGNESSQTTSEDNRLCMDGLWIINLVLHVFDQNS